MSTMQQPLKIIARLENSFAGNDPWIMLDGLLTRAAMERALGADFYQLPDVKQQSAILFPPLPLASINRPADGWLALVEEGFTWEMIDPIIRRHIDLRRITTFTADHLWFYCCSAAQYGLLVEEQQYWVKRPRTLEAEMYTSTRKIDIASGVDRMYRMPLITRVPIGGEIMWYAVGDMDAMYDLLQDISYIGKKAAYGNGRVIEWRIERVDEDKSITADGKPMRPVPAGLARDFGLDPAQAFWYGFRAPYFDRRNMAACILPESEFG